MLYHNWYFLPIRTNIGRARAWLRLATMQKRLSDYMRSLVEQDGGASTLQDFYEPSALIRSEESALIVGLLVSLNVVDCNICVKVGGGNSALDSLCEFILIVATAAAAAIFNLFVVAAVIVVAVVVATAVVVVLVVAAVVVVVAAAVAAAAAAAASTVPSLVAAVAAPFTWQ